MDVENRRLQVALIISLFLHGLVLAQNSRFRMFDLLRKNKPKDEIKVQYLRVIKGAKPLPRMSSENKEPFLKLTDKISIKPATLPPSINKKEDIFRAGKELAIQNEFLSKPTFTRPEGLSVKTSITISPPEIEKLNSSTYLAHAQIVREKIKRALYQNYNRIETGQVYLSFILSRTGQLKDVRLVEEKSSPSLYLRETAIRSIRAASPFPGFPVGLDYDQLSFNVVVSFELE